MDRLFTGSAGDRRRFLDRLVLALEPAHAHHAPATKQRCAPATSCSPTKLRPTRMADRARGGDGRARNGDLGARSRTVAALDERLAGAPEDEFARAQIALEGWDGGDLAVTLTANRVRDAAAGRTTEGPHRQDLAVVHRAKQMPAAQSSTGEQKALLLGLVLAHAELVADRRGSRRSCSRRGGSAPRPEAAAALFPASRAAARSG